MNRAASMVSSRWLVARGAAWVERRRTAHRPFAEPLGTELYRAFQPYFEPATLAATRVHRVKRIDPPWPVVIAARLRPLALDFGHVWGITYVDTVVMATDLLDEARLEKCLFHECVHVAQYRMHGLTGFVARYVSGWAEAGWSYRGIGLEREAYALQRRFEAGESFRVEEELERDLGAETAQYG